VYAHGYFKLFALQIKGPAQATMRIFTHFKLFSQRLSGELTKKGESLQKIYTPLPICPDIACQLSCSNRK
jgi:hypothetical protein